MIAGWSKLQPPLGAEGHGRGPFTPPPPSIASRPPFKEQNLLFCRSYGGRASLDPHSDSVSFPELKASLVENLIGALTNATEILDVYAHPSGVHGVAQWLLWFESSSSQDQDLALANHSVLHSESLELLLHERLSHSSSAQTSVSSSLGNVHFTSYPSQLHAPAHHAVQSSSAFHGDFSQGHRKLYANTPLALDQGLRNSNDSVSEEDLLLQEARSRAFRSGREPDDYKNASRGGLNDGLVDAAPPYSKQARNVGSGFLKENEIHTETENAWPFAGITRLSQENSLFWGWIALGTLLTGVLLVICRPIFPIGRQLQRPSVKRRILKSQWYGSPGSHLWENKNFQMRISECPKYPLLEVDGDKKLLRFPSESAGMSAAFARRVSQSSERTQTPQKQPIRQTIHGIEKSHVSSTNKAQGKPIRQTTHSGKMFPRKQLGSLKSQSNKVLNGGASVVQFPDTVIGQEASEEEESGSVVSQPQVVGVNGRRVRKSVQDYTFNQRISKINASKSKVDQGPWGRDDQLDLDKRIERLYQTIQAVEQHRRAAMLALEEEKQRSLALEEQMSKQREVAALLGEEVRLLKESHNALLTSLRKKYSTSAAARTAADLVYQDWERHVAAD